MSVILTFLLGRFGGVLVLTLGVLRASCGVLLVLLMIGVLGVEGIGIYAVLAVEGIEIYAALVVEGIEIYAAVLEVIFVSAAALKAVVVKHLLL